MIKFRLSLFFYVLLVGFIIAVRPAYAEDWQYVTTQKDGTMLYYDADSIRLADIDTQEKGFIVVIKEKLSDTAAKDAMKLILSIQPHVNGFVSYEITPVQFTTNKQCRPLGIYYHSDDDSLLLKIPAPPINKWNTLSIDNSLYNVYSVVLKHIAANIDYYTSQSWYSTNEKKFHEAPRNK